MPRQQPAAVITDAAYSQDDQRRRRERRYLAMMGIRIVAFILLAGLAMARVPWPWLWAPLCVAAMVLVPWMAVVIANDRPPRRRSGFQAGRGPGADQRALTAAAGPVPVDDPDHGGGGRGGDPRDGARVIDANR